MVSESRFVILSLGHEWAGDDEPNTTAFPELVELVADRIRATLGDSAASFLHDFIERVARYGSPTSLGYDHRTMSRTRASTGASGSDSHAAMT